METLSLYIDFVSASAGTTSPTGDSLSWLWILGILTLVIAAVVGIFAFKKFNFASNLFFVNDYNKIKYVKHSSNTYSLNAQRFKLIGVLIAVILAISTIGIFSVRSVFADPASCNLTPDTDTIIGSVQDDGSITFSTCNLKNTSDKLIALDTAAVEVADEAKSVAGIRASELTINSFDGCVYQGLPNGKEHQVKDCSSLEVGQSTPFVLEIANLDKQSAMELCGKHVFTLKLTLQPSTVYKLETNGYGTWLEDEAEVTSIEVPGYEVPEAGQMLTYTGLDGESHDVTATPIKGYIFGECRYDSDSKTFTAIFGQHVYDINYYDQGGEEFSGQHEEGYPEKHIYGTDTFLKGATKTGYTFGGWYSKEDCSGNEVRVLGATEFKDDINLYAKWNVNQYTITFDTDGGSTVAPITQNYGTPITAPANPAKTGYTFAGWNPEIPSIMPAENMTCTAQWTANTYTVFYEVQGHGTTPSSKPVIYGSAYGTLPALSETGYTFGGWYLDSGCSESKLVTAATIVKTAEDHNLYAKWICTVDFDMNGHGAQVPSQTIAQGDKASVPTPPTDGDYEFAGWYDSEDFTGSNPYNFNTPVTSNLTLHARWKGAAKIILQTGESYDGSLAGKGWVDNTDESGTVYKYFDLGTPFTDVLAEWNDSTTGKVTAITKTGYDFNEFKISEDQQSQTVITDDQTLWYPQWTAQPCTITPDNTFTSTSVVEVPGGCVWNIIYGHKSSTGTWFPTTVSAQKDGEDKATFVGTDTDDRPCKIVTYNGEEITSGDAISADGTLHLNIPDKQIHNPIAVAGLSYNGGAQIGVSHGEGYELSPSSDGGYLVPDIDSNGNATGTDAGEYGVVASLKPGYIWDDGTNDPYSVVFTIDYAQAKVTANDTSKIFGNDDPAFSATVTGLKKAEDDINYSISRVVGDNAGEYPINVFGDEIQGNYKVTFVAGKFTIYRAPIARPTGITGLIYNGELQTGATGGTGYTLEPSGKPDSMSPQIDADGNAKGLNATETVDGYTKTEYGVKAILDNNHQWVDGDNPTESHFFTFEIAKVDSTIEFAPGIAKFISLPSVTPVKKEIKGATGSYGNITYVVTPTDYFEIVVDEDNQTYLVCKGGTPAGTYNITAYANDAGDDNHKPGSTQAFAWTPTWVVTLQAHTVDFDMNGHGTKVPSQTIAQGDKATEPTLPTEEEYKFAGWYTSNEFTDQNLYNFDTPVTSSFTLYARWKGAAEIIFAFGESYDGSLGDKGWEGSTDKYGGVVYKYFDLGTPFTEVLAEWNNSGTGKVTAATKTGYDFDSFDIDDEQKSQITITDDETVWFIQWTPQEYDINYYDQGGVAYTGDNKTELIDKHIYDRHTELIGGVKAGYSFDGWYTSSACTGDSVKSLGAKDFTEGPINLYAKWTKKYKATVIKGEGEKFNATEMSGKEWKEDASGNWYKEFEALTAYSTILAEWGDASCWSTATSITKIGMTLTGFTPNVGQLVKDTNFSAQWTGKTYNVTFDIQGHGGTAPGSIQVTYEAAYGELPALSETGYEFGGWYLNQECSGSEILSSTIVKTASNHTLYAKWLKSIDFTVQETINGSSSSVTYYPVFDSVPDGVTFYDSSNNIVTTMNPSIKYALAEDDVPIQTVRTVNGPSWTNTFNQASGVCKLPLNFMRTFYIKKFTYMTTPRVVLKWC